MSGNDPATPQAEKLVKQFEGCRLTVYADPGTGSAPWTIGWGSTRDLNDEPFSPGTPPIIQQLADQLLARDLQEAFDTVRATLKTPLTLNEAGALADLDYNIGGANFRSSTLAKDINAGNFEAAAAQFDLWDHANGRELSGLLRRRQAEEAEFNTPDQPQGA